MDTHARTRLRPVRHLARHLAFRRCRRALASDAGFSLVEVVVAMSILFALLLGLAHSATIGLTDIGLARQRQAANGLANRLIEQTRGMEYERLTQGLRTEDLQANLGDDPNIASCGGVLYLTPACPPPLDAEELVHAPGLDPAGHAPLVPYRSEVGGPPEFRATYTGALYVTHAKDAPDAGAFRLVAIVDWDRTLRAGAASRVVVETLVYSPEGCVDPSTHPFAAPCEPFFFGSIIADQGAIDISGVLQGTSFEAQMLTPSARTDAQLEQARRIQSSVRSSGVRLNEQATEGTTASVAADDAIGTALPVYDTATLAGVDPASFTLSASTGTLRVNSTTQLSGGDSGSATAAMSAGAPAPGGGLQDCPQPPPPPDPLTDEAPCGHGDVRQGMALSTALDLKVLTLPLAQMPLAKVEAPATPTWTLADRDRQSGADGQIIASARRSVGTVELLGLPGGLLNLPLGFEGYMVRLTGYTAEASAAAGTGTDAPSAAVTSGTLRVWTGGLLNKYTNIPVASGPQTITLPTINLNQTLLVGLGLVNVRVTIGGTVSIGAGSVADPDGPGSDITRESAQAQIGSPIEASLTARVVVAGSTILDADVNVDLGGLLVRSTYRPAE